MFGPVRRGRLSLLLRGREREKKSRTGATLRSDSHLFQDLVIFRGHLAGPPSPPPSKECVVASSLRQASGCSRAAGVIISCGSVQIHGFAWAVWEIKITCFLVRFTSNLFRLHLWKKKPTRAHLNLLLCGPTQNPFNLIFDKIIKLIDDVTNLNNLGKLSPDKHFPGWRADTAGLAQEYLFLRVFCGTSLLLVFIQPASTVCRETSLCADKELRRGRRTF